jgi:hypothetical protein
MDLWLAEQRRRSKPQTVQSARSHVARLLPQHCSRLIERRRKQGVSASTINTTLRILRAILNFGIEQ